LHLDKEFLISSPKKRNYWWQTKNVATSDRGLRDKTERKNNHTEFMVIEYPGIGIIVTKDTLRKEEFEGCRLSFIPIWPFLLLI
jgi:hypothetical protein